MEKVAPDPSSVRICDNRLGDKRNESMSDAETETENLSMKESRLRKIIREAAAREKGGNVLIGFSGGMDSSLLLWESVQALRPDNVIAVTATSPTSIVEEEMAAREFAAHQKVRHLVVPTLECSDPAFMANPVDRCYVCKRIRFGMLKELAAQFDASAILDGSQADDDPADRPGMRALAELGILSPLIEAGIGKADVRHLLRGAGFPALAAKNPQPCLATRIPAEEPITLEALEMVRRGEQHLKDYGFSVVRLRHHGSLARVVLDGDGISRILTEVGLREAVAKGLKTVGYQWVTLDLLEYGMGQN
jgi:pyridinium-3,5-biscarboxylic acid mononucleotide sulfurtransferase